MDEELRQTIIKARKAGTLSRKNFYLFLLSFFLLPQFTLVAAAIFSQKETQALFLTGLLISAFALVAIVLLLRKWERKMQLSVTSLVQAKLQHLNADSKIQEEHQFDHYKHQIEELQKMFEESQRGYEHQIDLLHSSIAKSKQQADELYFELERKEKEVRQITLTLEGVKKEMASQMEHQLHTHREIEEALSHKESLLSEYNHTISEQRMVIEKKQRYIAKLEGKVSDLMYEIRSLLQLEDPVSSSSSPSPSFVDAAVDAVALDEFPETYSSSGATTYDLSIQLQRYIQIAQNFTGAEHLGYVNGKSPRFFDVSFDSYAIDLRRLFDSFREETIGIIFVYSQMEEKFLFINNFVRTVLGWSSEKFMKDFPQLIEMGYPDWYQALAKLPSLKETQVRLVIRSKTGEEILFQCFMGLISQGPFSNHAIGILAPIST